MRRVAPCRRGGRRIHQRTQRPGNLLRCFQTAKHLRIPRAPPQAVAAAGASMARLEEEARVAPPGVAKVGLLDSSKVRCFPDHAWEAIKVVGRALAMAAPPEVSRDPQEVIRAPGAAPLRSVTHGLAPRYDPRAMCCQSSLALARSEGRLERFASAIFGCSPRFVRSSCRAEPWKAQTTRG